MLVIFMHQEKYGEKKTIHHGIHLIWNPLKCLQMRIGMGIGFVWENYPLETELHVDDSYSFAIRYAKKFCDS